MRTKRMHDKRAMTLVEILIGAAIMSIAAVGIYELFFSGAKTAAVSMWRSASNIELRNGLRLISEDLGRASYPSVVHDGGTDIDRDVKCTIQGGRTDVRAGGAGTLLDFYMCKPEITVAGTGRAGERIHCTLEVEGRTLRYRRDSGPTPLDKVIIHDVDYVELGSTPAADDPEKNLVSIEIGTVHPSFDTTKVVERTEAKVEVDVAGGA